MSDARPTPGTTASGRGVRPLSWVILATTLILIAAVLGAWRGSASRMGAVPAIEFSTVSDPLQDVTAKPTLVADAFTGDGAEHPEARLRIAPRDVVWVRLPSELRGTRVSFSLVPDGSRDDRTPITIAGSDQTSFPIPASEYAAAHRDLRIDAQPLVYAADGSQTVLNCTWIVVFEPVGAA